MTAKPSPRDEKEGRIEVYVRDLKQLFHTLDPSAFYERDLDDKAEEYIIDNAKELPHDVPFSLIVHVDQPTTTEQEVGDVRGAIGEHFARRAERSRMELRQLFRRGRMSLAIGLPFLAASVVGGEVVAHLMQVRPWAFVLRESLLVGGWVAMWRPLEIFLYDWWPIREETRLFRRLAAMSVQLLPITESRS